ncbi:MAG: undecaprenyl-phosphate glucose phosphotransferase [Chakrabartia sp.]
MAADRARAPILLDLTALLLRVLEPLLLLFCAVAVQLALGDRIAPSAAPFYLRAALMGAIIYAGIAEAIGGYDMDVRFALRRATGRVLTALFATAMFVLTVGFFLKVSEEFSRLWAVGWFGLGAVLLCLARGLLTLWMQGKKRDGLFNQRVAVFGAGEQGRRLARYIESHDRLTIDLVGFFDDRTDGRVTTPLPQMPLGGGLDALVSMVRAGRVDQVILALPWAADARLQQIVAALAVTPVQIRLAPDLANFTFAHRPIVLLGELPVMTLFERPISGLDSIVKRIEDLALLAAILPLALPIMLVAALAIKLDSPGPIFFRQDREGYNNQRFAIWKFRSMRTDRLEFDNIRQASRTDPRITRVGRILRKTSIDELPQLINVLTGEMSLVGPRPHAPSTRAGSRFFGEIVSTYAARHNVKPGLTGWAQVCGWRGETDTEDKLIRRLEHDLHYIENWSVWFDLVIIVRSVWAVIAPRNAY